LDGGVLSEMPRMVVPFRSLAASDQKSAKAGDVLASSAAVSVEAARLLKWYIRFPSRT
jgi:hypothetical protein